MFSPHRLTHFSVFWYPTGPTPLSRSSTLTGSFSGRRGTLRGVPTDWGALRLRGASMPATETASSAFLGLRRQPFWTYTTPRMLGYPVCGHSEWIRMLLLNQNHLVCLLENIYIHCESLGYRLEKACAIWGCCTNVKCLGICWPELWNKWPSFIFTNSSAAVCQYSQRGSIFWWNASNSLQNLTVFIGSPSLYHTHVQIIPP